MVNTANEIFWADTWRLIQALWPRWDATPEQESLWKDKLAWFPPGVMKEAVREVAAVRAVYTPRLAWVIDMANVKYQVYKRDHPRKQQAERKLRQDLAEDDRMVYDHLNILQPEELIEYRDEVNAKVMFGTIEGTDLDEWTPFQRSLVWATRQNHLEQKP